MSGAMDVEAVAGDHHDPRFRRRLAVLVGIAAVAAACLSLLESHSGREEEQAFTDASRSGLEVFVKIASGQPRFGFEVGIIRDSALLDALAVSRTTAVTGEIEPLQIGLGLSSVENRAARRLLLLGNRLRKLPESAELDDVVSEAIRVRDARALDPLIERQNEAVDRAGEYGTRQERAMFALGLVAIAASLLGLAGLMGAGRGGNLSLATAAALLVVAVAWGGSGLVF